MNRQIQDVIANKPNRVEDIGPDATVEGAVARMNELHIGSLLVIEDAHLVGIVTERDLLVRVLAAGRDPATTKVRDVMTRELVVINLHETVEEAMVLVTRRRCRHLPVVDGDRICGLVSAGDLTAWLVREQQQTIDDLYQYVRQG